MNASIEPLPPERDGFPVIARQFSLVGSNPELKALLDTFARPLLILNERRQLIYANRAAFQILELKSGELIAGRRLGEVVQCMHAEAGSGGCGTASSCAECEAAIAMVEAERWGVSRRNYSLPRKAGLGNLNLKVRMRSVLLGSDRLFVMLPQGLPHAAAADVERNPAENSGDWLLVPQEECRMLSECEEIETPFREISRLIAEELTTAA